MKIFFTATSLFLSILCFSQIHVVQFNANWNSANSIPWLTKLSDCKINQVDIVTDKAAQQKYKIVVVPTIIVFNNGEEIKRYQANIMMKLDAKLEDIQTVIDEIIMESF